MNYLDRTQKKNEREKVKYHKSFSEGMSSEILMNNNLYIIKTVFIPLKKETSLHRNQVK